MPSNAYRVPVLPDDWTVMQRDSEGSPFWKRLTETYGRYFPMSQTAVGRAYGGGQSKAQRWFNGTAMPEWDTLADMAEKGRTTLDYLVTGKLPRNRIRLVGDLLRLCQIWEALSDDGKSAVLHSAESTLTLEQHRAESTGQHRSLTPDEIARLLRSQK